MRRAFVDALLWCGAGFSAVLILWLSFFSVPTGTGLFPGADKVEHAVAYLTLTLFVLLAGVWRPGRGPGPLEQRWFAISAAIVVAGGAIEVSQGLFTADRNADVLDWVAEIAGVFAAAVLVGTLRRRAQRPVDSGTLP